MKKFFFIALFFIMTNVSKAQTSNSNFKLDIGATGALPVGQGFADDQSFGIGGFIKGSYKIHPKIEGIVIANYNNFFGKTINTQGSTIKVYPAQIFSILAGGSYTIYKRFHIDGRAGFATLSQQIELFGKQTYNSFTYSVGAGYRLTNSLDATLNFNGLSNGLPIAFVAVGISYLIVK